MNLLDKISSLLQRLFPADFDEDGEDWQELGFTSPFGRDSFRDPPVEKSNNKGRMEDVISVNATTRLSVVLVKPVRFEDATEIADLIKRRQTVLLNLESVKRDEARKIVDFISGVVYASDGVIEKAATNIFIITPYSVDIMGDLLDELNRPNYFF